MFLVTRIARRLELLVSHRAFAGEFLLFAFSTISMNLSRLVVSLVVAKWVGPSEFGVWSALQLFLVYGIAVTVGVPNGMNREVPRLLGSGHRQDSVNLANGSFGFVVLTTGATALLLLGAGLALPVPSGYGTGLVALAPLFVAFFLYTYFQFLLKCNIRFKMMSVQQLSHAALFPLIVLPFSRFLGVDGFILGQALVCLLLVILIRRMAPIKVGRPLTIANWRLLARIGFPIMAAGLVYALMSTADRWIILSFLGTEALGHYAVAILTMGTLRLLPRVVAEQMYPRMAFHFGKTDSQRALVPIIIKQTVISGALTIPVVLGLYFPLPWAVNTFMPAYSQGVIPAQILLVGLGVLSLAGGMGNFLNTVDKQVYYLLVQVGALITFFACGIGFVAAGWGLVGVALAGSISYTAFTLALALVTAGVIRRSAKA